MTASRPRIVLDASVALALVLEEADSPAVRQALSRWATDDVELVVPGHFWLEVLNIVGRARGGTGQASIEAVHALQNLAIETVEIDPAMVVLTIGAMERSALTAYDAAYLGLAESLDAPLATLDRALHAAAGPRGLDPRLDPGAHRLSEAPGSYGERPATWPMYRGASAYLSRLRAQARESAAGASRA